jgi:hypothetical protein
VTARRRLTDRPHPAYAPGAFPVLSALLLFWALVAIWWLA